MTITLDAKERPVGGPINVGKVKYFNSIVIISVSQWRPVMLVNE